MAVDQTLLEAAEGVDGRWSFSLRLYAWRRPTVSLGFAQPWLEGFVPGLARRLGVGLVRRPSGGRAVLHDDEITYCLAGPAGAEALGGGILAAYRRLAEGLAAGLHGLGAEVEVWRSSGADEARGGASSPPSRRSGACFASRARYELVWRGRKLAGSAQRRAGGRVLQHGSLPIGRPDPGLWRALGPGGPEAAAATTGLADVIGTRPSRRRLAAALAQGIGQALGCETAVRGLSVSERRRAAALQRHYRDPAWTLRR